MPSLNKIFQSTNVANISKRKIRNEKLTISLQKIYWIAEYKNKNSQFISEIAGLINVSDFFQT